MKIAHLTTVDLSLRYLILPQLVAAKDYGESIGISAPGPHVEFLEKLGVRHIPLVSSTRGMSPLDDLRAAIQLWHILRKERVDLLHTHNPKPGVYGRVVGRLSGVPIVVNTVHGLYATEESPILKRAVVYTLEWVASRFSDAELIQSPEDYDLVLRRHLTPRSKTTLLGNGVDLRRFNPVAVAAHRAEVREELGIGEGQVVVGMVGRLVNEKGIPELIEAAAQLDDRFVVVIVGPHDPEKADAVSSELIDRAESLGVRFLGMRTDVERLYSGFDMFVLPSHREGFPRAAMEAAACGLPVIATDIRGCRQVVDDGSTGLLFKVGDVAGLRDAVTQIGSDSNVLSAYGAASAEKANLEFNEDSVVETVVATYNRLLAQKGLSWKTNVSDEITIRKAVSADIPAVAELHRSMIPTGFLSSLGSRFLRVLYGAMVEDASSVVAVAVSGDNVVGFIAGTSSTGTFYKRFLRSYFVGAVLAMFPSVLNPMVWKRVYESLKYGSEDSRADAELLSMAVAPSARRQGVGRRLLASLIAWAKDGGIDRVKVVVGESNSAATTLYNSGGFVNGRRIAVHSDTASWEFIWSA